MNDGVLSTKERERYDASEICAIHPHKALHLSMLAFLHSKFRKMHQSDPSLLGTSYTPGDDATTSLPKASAMEASLIEEVAHGWTSHPACTVWDGNKTSVKKSPQVARSRSVRGFQHVSTAWTGPIYAIGEIPTPKSLEKQGKARKNCRNFVKPPKITESGHER